jgi:hypothetical protein
MPIDGKCVASWLTLLGVCILIIMTATTLSKVNKEKYRSYKGCSHGSPSCNQISICQNNCAVCTGDSHNPECIADCLDYIKPGFKMDLPEAPQAWVVECPNKTCPGMKEGYCGGNPVYGLNDWGPVMQENYSSCGDTLKYFEEQACKLTPQERNQMMNQLKNNCPTSYTYSANQAIRQCLKN